MYNVYIQIIEMNFHVLSLFIYIFGSTLAFLNSHDRYVIAMVSYNSLIQWNINGRVFFI